LLHFVCHGKLLDNGETVLYWAQADNQVQTVTGEDLIGELKNIGNYHRGLPHFAFLCTCESADPRAEEALGGLAQRLVRDLGMPAVVEMTRKVSVETALALGQTFYRRLRESGEVDVALQEATAGLGDRYDITVPALFSRLGGRPLFSDRLDDRDLTDNDIENGIRKLRELLDERAPVLQQRFKTQVEKLNNTRGADSQAARKERERALEELNNLCDQVLDLSFDALAVDNKLPPYQAKCPFPGLSSFGNEKYREFFFGRDELIKELKQELERDNFLALSGISGSGKSSVVLAGLIPKLKEQEPSLQSVRITPSNEPLKQLEILLNVSEQPSVLVVDQFEELFTLCENKDTRQEFITKLLNLASHRKVVVTMRVDFLGECTFYPELSKRIETRQKLVGPMQPAELITAMKMQADKADLRFEAGLSDSILNDVKEEPGAMPLLQYALQELWKRRHGRWLCHEEYQAIGRVQQAIAKTADDFYNSLPASEREQVRNIFLRLTRMDASAVQGEKRQATGRRVELEDLVSAGSDLAATKKLVQQLAGEKARLVVTSRNEATEKDEVEVAHEALISYWPKLQNWLNENRNDLLLRQDINDAAEKWQQHQEQLDKDSYLTHKGGRLEDAEKLLKEPKFVHLNPLEADYVNACVELRDRLSRKEKARMRRIAGLRLAILGVILLLGTPVATLVVTVLTTLKQKPNVVFVSPGYNIQGTTDYKYFYTARLLSNPQWRAVIHQLVIGVPGEGAPGCIEVNILDNGEKQQDKANFALTAPEKPGVYYVLPSFHMHYSCPDAIKERQKPEFQQIMTDRNPNPVGVIVVGNVLNFTIYPGLWEAYKENVPNVGTDHTFGTGVYYFLQDIKLRTMPSNR
jgi:energy-coupling factor transporter ATP-binding protein EcfA2